MAVNKVVYDGKALIDLTADTVTPETLVTGFTAHNASGQAIAGTFDPSIYVQKTDTEAFVITDEDLESAFSDVFTQEV